MKKLLLLFCLLSGSGVGNVIAQETPHSPFEDNVVKVRGSKGPAAEDPAYGFITGDNPATKTLYFVMIFHRNTRGIKNVMEVMFDNEADDEKKIEVAVARRVATVDLMRQGSFNIILYEINSSRKINKNFYAPIKSAQFDGYKILTDFEKSDLNFDVYQNQAKIRRLDEAFSVRKSVTFGIPNENGKGKPGLPVLNEAGIVCGLTAMAEKDNSKFEVLDITGIRDQLYAAGGTNECKYFNLIEEGKTLTPCQQRERDLALDIQKRKIEEARIRALSLKEQRRILADKNYFVTMSATAGGNILAYPQANSDAYSGSYGYLLGADFYILPDKGPVTLAIRPRFTGFGVSAGSDYRNESNPNFTWGTARFTSLEVPVLLDIKQRNKGGSGNYFFGIGYVLGRQKVSKFSFTESGVTQKQGILANPTLVKKIMAELGIEQGRCRLALFGAYQTTPLLRTDYELILSGARVRPFENAESGSITFGLELSIRLWGRWQNGIIY